MRLRSGKRSRDRAKCDAGWIGAAGCSEEAAGIDGLVKGFEGGEFFVTGVAADLL